MGLIKDNKFVQLVLVGIIATGCYYGWKSDIFQKTVFPEDYWQKVIEDSERIIAFNDSLIRSFYRELKKIQLTERIEIADSMHSSETIGLTKEQARDIALQEIEDKIESNDRTIEMLTSLNDKYRKDLEFAKKRVGKNK